MANQHVLLVEDNDIEARLFEQALRIARPKATLSRVPEVLAAVYYLRGIGVYANRDSHPLPYLVVIDLYLHTVNGIELLKWMHSEPAMKGITVLVHSASEKPADADLAYAHGANFYLKKAHDRNALVADLELLHESWGRQGLLPPEAAAEGVC